MRPEFRPIAYFEQVIPNELIELIAKEIKKISEISFEESKIMRSPQVSGENKNIRNSKVSWLNDGHWISSIFSHYINLANKEIWEYDITYLQPLQVTSYEVGGNYKWHCDYEGTGNDVRKLSASLLITDLDEYKGGNLCLVGYDGETINLSPPKGTMIVFDSRIPHRVSQVTEGKRISIVGWMCGPKLR